MRRDDERAVGEFVERVRGTPGLEAVVLFGSLARGDGDRRSDVDLLLVATRGQVDAVRERALGAAAEVDTERQVRPVVTDLADHDPDFLGNALRDGVVLFGRVVAEPSGLALRPYSIVSYSLKGLPPGRKVALHRAVNGYRVETRRGGRTYVSEHEGLAGRGGVIRLGRGVVAVPADEAATFARVLDEAGAAYSVRKAWM